MRKNGFTLIELLAIIVILAIIAVITVPIVLGIIDNSKRGAAKDSAFGYKDAVNKWYLEKIALNSNYILDGTFTIINGKLNDEEITVSGIKPTFGTLIYSNNILQGGCLTFDDYKVTFDEGMVASIEKGRCHVSIDGSFENDSWQKILENLSIDRHSYDNEIGKTRVERMNLEGSLKDYKLRLVNTDACGSYDVSRTACGVVIEFATTIGSHRMNDESTNAGGWYESSMRAYLNTGTNSIYSKLKGYIGENTIILTSPVVSSSGNGGVSNNSQDYLYLLANKELGILGHFDNKDSYTNVLKYYNDNNSNAFRKKYNDISETTSLWCYWLRSAISYSSMSNGDKDFATIKSSGSGGNLAANDTCYVAPAFRIMD